MYVLESIKFYNSYILPFREDLQKFMWLNMVQASFGYRLN